MNNDNNNNNNNDDFVSLISKVAQSYVSRPTTNPNGAMLMELLQQEESQHIVSNVVNGGVLVDAFFRAGALNQMDLFQAFLNRGMAVNLRDRDDYTALMYICNFGLETRESFQLLFDRGAGVDFQTRRGLSALILATINNRSDVVQMLLEHHANPDLQSNINGRTALMYASQNGHPKVIELLLNHGADKELKSLQEEKAIDFAKTEAIRELFRNHVDNSYILK